MSRQLTLIGFTQAKRRVQAALGLVVAVALTALAAGPVFASVKPGEKAPEFTLVDSDGVTRHLKDFKGSKVILEWTNHQCPYVKKQYVGSRNMQDLQKEMTAKGIVWLTIISSAPGKQGHVTGAEANAIRDERGAAPTHILMDEKGDVGRAYDAMTTPDMYLLDEKGHIAYMGAIDSDRSARPKNLEGATNYVRQAVAQLEAGEEVSRPVTAPYGCSIKY